MSQALSFHDFSFKLAVITRLYQDGILRDQFDTGSCIEEARGWKQGEGYRWLDSQYMQGLEDVIPEAKAYFESLKITDSMVNHITELFSDGGDKVYLDIYPFWSGEDDTFDIKSAEDVKLLPKLKKARLLFGYPGTELKNAFMEQGVELYF
jgi:hypothetical protein